MVILTEKTSVGISVKTIDKAKIHLVQHKGKYDSLTDLVDKAVESKIASDNDTNSKSIK